MQSVVVVVEQSLHTMAECAGSAAQIEQSPQVDQRQEPFPAIVLKQDDWSKFHYRTSVAVELAGSGAGRCVHPPQVWSDAAESRLPHTLPVFRGERCRSLCRVPCITWPTALSDPPRNRAEGPASDWRVPSGGPIAVGQFSRELAENARGTGSEQFVACLQMR